MSSPRLLRYGQENKLKAHKTRHQTSKTQNFHLLLVCCYWGETAEHDYFCGFFFIPPTRPPKSYTMLFLKEPALGLMTYLKYLLTGTGSGL